MLLAEWPDHISSEISGIFSKHNSGQIPASVSMTLRIFLNENNGGIFLNLRFFVYVSVWQRLIDCEKVLEM